MLAVRPACELRFGKEKSAERLCFLRVKALDHGVPKVRCSPDVRGYQNQSMSNELRRRLEPTVHSEAWETCAKCAK